MTAPAPTLAPAPAPPAIPPAPSVDALTTRLIAQHGTVENALRYLVTASITTDQQVATLTQERNDLRARLPEGAVVLTKEEAGNWKKLVDLKLTPDQIEAAVKKLPTVEGELAKRDSEKAARAVAVAAGLDPEGYAAHVAAHPQAVEWRDVQVTEKGKAVTRKMPFVRPGADEKAVFLAASEYVAKLPAHEQRALAATTTQPVSGPVAHEQKPTPTGANTGSDPVAEYTNRRFALRQPAAAAAS